MLKDRILILQQGNIITKEVADFTIRVIDMMNRDYPEVSDEKTERFTTHLAMATQRVMDHKEEESLGEAMMEEVLEHPAYGKACDFLEKIKAVSCVEFSGIESEFLLVHLCNLFAAES